MPSERRIRIAIAIASVLGFAVALYLTIKEASGELPQCVAGGGGCATVATSDYADLAGVPVAYIGLGGYAAILATTLLRGDAGRFAGAVMALVGFGFSLYLTYVELFVIDAVCQYCVASAVAMTALAFLTGWRLVRFGGATVEP